MDIFYLIFIPFMAIATATIAFVYHFTVVRQKHKGSHCTSMTRGTVIRYTRARYNGIHLPIVAYQVQGQDYQVKGPDFSSYRETSIATPFHSAETEFNTNLRDREHLPQTLLLSSRRNSIIFRTRSPLLALYPIGAGDVQVYYNPDHPEEAFIQRYCPPAKWLEVLLKVSFVISVLILLGLLTGFFMSTF